MLIQNALVYSEDHTFQPGDVAIENGLFAEHADGEIIDAAGCYAIPGLIDIHFHGAAGCDFCDATPEALETIADYEAKNGVTAICPASITYSEEILTNVYLNAAACKGRLRGAELVGINMEGPFFSMEKKGAQNPKYIQNPDSAMFERLQKISGNLIKLCCLAPELDGAYDFIRRHAGEVVLSIAHTTADYETAREAIRLGATHVTHLFNAMPPLTHRAPGVIGAALDGGCEVELITDGIHIHPSAVRAAFKLFGERIILISDSLMAAGLPDGDYALGELPLRVIDGRATLHDGTIAGSTTNVMGCMRTAVLEMDIPLEAAVRAATEAPARSIGVFDRRGSIAPGKVADLVLLDKETLAVRSVILRGKRYA